MFIPDDPKIRERELGGFTPDGSSDSFTPDSSFDYNPAPEPEKNLWQKYSDSVNDFSIGVAQGELKTAEGLQKAALWLGEKFNLPGQIAEFVTNGRMTAHELSPNKTIGEQLMPDDVQREDLLTAKNGMQEAGQFIERMAEFLAPGPKGTGAINSLASNVAKYAPKAKGAIETGVKMLGHGAMGGGITAVQRNDIDTEAKVNAIISAAFPVLGSMSSKFGTSIMNKVVKPSQADVKNGFKAENLKKYGLGGSLRTTLEKTTNQLNKFGDLLDEKLSNSDAVIDINKIYQRTADRIGDKKKILFGRVADLKRGLKELTEDIDDMAEALGQKMPDGSINAQDMTKIPIATANNQIKRGAGTKGSWVYGRIDKDARAIERVYSVFYNELKKEIEKRGPNGIRSLNKKMGDLIPIQSAILRRIPVAERNNVIGLEGNMAIIGSLFDPRALASLVPIIASKSGSVANMLMNASESYLGKGASAGIKSLISNIKSDRQ